MKLKILKPKNRGYVIEYQGRQYKIEIITKPSGDTTIKINDRVVVEEEFNENTRRFFPIIIDNKEVIIEIMRKDGNIKNYIFIDGISIKTGDDIEKGKRDLQKIIDGGMFNYLLGNINRIIFKLLSYWILFAVIDKLKELRRNNDTDLSSLIFGLFIWVPFCAIFSIGSHIIEWFSIKSELKEWDSLFREPIHYNSV